MLRNLTISICIIASISIGNQTKVTQSSYLRYQKPKVITEMEWKLLQIGLRLAPKEVYISYNSDSGVFEATAWVMTTDIERTTTTDLRDGFNSLIDYVNTLLNGQFLEFSNNGSKDLVIKWIIGRSGGDVIALYETKHFRFTDAYYEYLREIGR